MLPNLPFALVDEILARVPTKSLIRFRSTCKRWISVIDDRAFSGKQFDNAPKESMCIFYSDRKTFVVTCALGKLDCYEVNLCKLNINNQFYDIYHCDGLLCCLNEDFDLMVWNPCLKQTRLIQVPDIDFSNTFQFAFGCDKKSGGCKYKILAFLRDQDFTSSAYCSKYLVVQLYDFTSNCWIVLNAKIDFRLRFSRCWVSLKGNSYWVAADEITGEGIVLTFDFSTEMFRRMSLPLLVDPAMDHHLSMSVKNDRIFILHQRTPEDIVEIWMTGSVIDGHQISWSKLMTVDENKFDSHYIPLDFFVHDEENKVVVFGDKFSTHEHRVCVIEEERFTQTYVESVGQLIWPLLHNYVPSLVPIP